MIDGVVIRSLTKYIDERGWLCELFRRDELEESSWPVMAYVSTTLPGVARGPHEHERQTDIFAFIGPGNFKVYLWDNRKDSPTFGVRQTVCAGQDAPRLVIVPPGVVHAYRNIGHEPGVVFNAPNALYAGEGRTEPVDEIRHEDDPASRFALD
jgi:dTDP-4-dehydrorhamnose 3,5-epimerase